MSKQRRWLIPIVHDQAIRSTVGTTVDILSAENGYQFSADKKWNYVRWLEKNAHRYNFKISYPEGSTEYQYEPWHIRWYPPSKK